MYPLAQVRADSSSKSFRADAAASSKRDATSVRDASSDPVNTALAHAIGWVTVTGFKGYEMRGGTVPVDGRLSAASDGGSLLGVLLEEPVSWSAALGRLTLRSELSVLSSGVLGRLMSVIDAASLRRLSWVASNVGRLALRWPVLIASRQRGLDRASGRVGLC